MYFRANSNPHLSEQYFDEERASNRQPGPLHCRADSVFRRPRREPNAFVSS